jgi:transposase InsO family protein
LSLEFELLATNYFTTRLQAHRAVVGWIEEYNHIRRHSNNAMLAPVAFEQARSRTGKRAA